MKELLRAELRMLSGGLGVGGRSWCWWGGQEKMCSHWIWMGNPWLKPAALQWGFSGVKQGQNLPWVCFKCFIPRAAAWVPVRLCPDTGALLVESKR